MSAARTEGEIHASAASDAASHSTSDSELFYNGFLRNERDFESAIFFAQIFGGSIYGRSV
jgi:hypothetical protein